MDVKTGIAPGQWERGEEGGGETIEEPKPKTRAVVTDYR